MANDLIKVSTEEMAATISAYMTEKAKLMEAFQICTDTTSLIARSWAGPSFGVVSAKMAMTWKNLFDTEHKINDAIDELKKTIGIFEEAESTNKSNFSGLSAGTSPFN